MNIFSNSNNYDVFISYNRTHDSQVKTLYYELTVTHNLACWLDEFEIMPDLMFEGLAKGISMSKLFLCCISKKYCETQFCIDEIMYARNLKKPIVVLMLEDLKEKDMGKISSIIKKSVKIPVYDFKSQLLEKSDSELYKKIIEATLESLNNQSKNVPDDTLSIDSLPMNVQETPRPQSQLKSVRSMNKHEGAIFVVQCLPEDRLASGSADCTIKIWDTNTFDLIKTLHGHTENVTNLKLCEGDKLVSGSNDSNIMVWNLVTYDLIKTFKGHSGSISCIKELPDKNLATCSYDSTIRIWCLHTYTCLKVIEKFKSRSTFKSLFKKTPHTSGHSKPVFCLKVSGSYLLSGSEDTLIKLWNLTDNFNHENTLEGHTGIVISLKNLTNNRLASASFDKTIKIWDMINFVCMQTLTGHIEEIQCLAVLPNNQLASGGCDFNIKIWDLNAENECIKTLKGHTKNVNIIKQLSNNRLISFSNDNQIILWDFSKQEILEIYSEHLKCVASASLLMPNRIATGSWDQSVKVWDFI